MASAQPKGQGGSGGGPPGEGLLGRPVRRDLTDLNLRHMELALGDPDPADPLVCWSPEVLREIRGAGRDVLLRMADCPFSLFEIHLADVGARAAPPGAGVRDAGSGASRRSPGSAEFTRTALFAAWRMADGAPLAARVVFGLTPAEELLLNELCPSQVASVADDPRAVRARWPDRARYWAMLRTAAESGRPAALQWVHCLGISLMGRGNGGDRPSADEAARGRARR